MSDPKPLWKVIFASLMVGFFPLSQAAFEGTVTAVNPEANRLTVESGSGEQRTFVVGRGDAKAWEVGDRIRGNTVPHGPHGDWRLQAIWPSDPALWGRVYLLTDRLRRDTLQRGQKAFRAVGEALPRFALIDQGGDLFLSEGLKGRFAIINFIFTRCPDPDMCPRSTRQMQALLDALKAEGLEDRVTLVSISLDPSFDTPGIWRAYAEAKGIDLDHHVLLTGPVVAVESLEKQFGILAEPDRQEIIRHTITTTLIGPKGTVLYRLPGNDWEPKAFVGAIQKHLDEAS